MPKSLLEIIASKPAGWRMHMGDTPYWDQNKPKHLRKRPFEAYVVNDVPIGRKGYIFESSDGATLEEALSTALDRALARR